MPENQTALHLSGGKTLNVIESYEDVLKAMKSPKHSNKERGVHYAELTTNQSGKELPVAVNVLNVNYVL